MRNVMRRTFSALARNASTLAQVRGINGLKNEKANLNVIRIGTRDKWSRSEGDSKKINIFRGGRTHAFASD